MKGLSLHWLSVCHFLLSIIALGLILLKPISFTSISCEKALLDSSKRKELGTCFSQRWRCLRLISRLELMGLLSSLCATHPSMLWPFQVSFIHQFILFFIYFIFYVWYFTFVVVWLVIMGLKNRFDEAARRNDVKAIVLTGNIIIRMARIWFFFFKMVALIYTIDDNLIVSILIFRQRWEIFWWIWYQCYAEGSPDW